MNDFKARADQLTLDIKAATEELNKYLGVQASAQKQLDDLAADYTRLQVRKNSRSGYDRDFFP